jgi:hypothetical protein
MVEVRITPPARAAIDDVLQGLGKARLSLDLVKDLLHRTGDELDRAADQIACAASSLRSLLENADFERWRDATALAIVSDVDQGNQEGGAS